MPYQIQFEPWAERVRVLGSGPSHYEETAEAIRGLAADPRYLRGYGMIVDTRNLDYVPSLEDARRLAELFRGLKSTVEGGIAVVVEGTARYGVAQMIATLLENRGVTMAAFRDPASAEAWLAESQIRREGKDHETQGRAE
ncbi:MAG: hypothetical protein L0170_07540 [Acidobacteria bacterium]|nr:hypothetical protein [Acidobacteriota bacterium]